MAGPLGALAAAAARPARGRPRRARGRPTPASSSGSAAARPTSTRSTRSAGATARRRPGSYYDAIPTASAGVQVCEHLPGLADRLDRCVLVRSLHHKIIDEHGAATNLVHTGRPVSGTIVYPSLGSIVSHERGPGGDGVPAYVVIGYPNVTPGAGLPRLEVRLRLPDRHRGRADRPDPAGRRRPGPARPPRGAARIASGPTSRRPTPTSPAVADYVAACREAARLSGPAFRQVFQLDREPSRGAQGVRRRVRPALPAGPPAGRVGGPVRRGRAQPQLPQRHRLGHPQPGPAPAARADRRARPGALRPARRPRARRPARFDARRRRHRVRPPRRVRLRRAAAGTSPPPSAPCSPAAASGPAGSSAPPTTSPGRSSSAPCRSPTSTPRSTPRSGSTPPRSCDARRPARADHRPRPRPRRTLRLKH